MTAVKQRPFLISPYVLVISVWIFLSYSFTAIAENHTETAVQRATEAAESKDSASIREHVEEALKHTESAKQEHTTNPEALQHLQEGEAALNKAEENARWHNTNSAIEQAQEAKRHLEAVGK